MLQGPADDLVDRVVTADVLAHDERLAGAGVEQPGRVVTASMLVLPHTPQAEEA